MVVSHCRMISRAAAVVFLCSGSAGYADTNCPDPRAPVSVIGSQPDQDRGVVCIGVASDPQNPNSENASGVFYTTGSPGVTLGPGRVINVASGATAAGSTDAINGGQINQLGNSVASALGGGSSFDRTGGTVMTPMYNVQGTAYSSVGGALTALDVNASSLTRSIDAVRFDLRRVDRARQASGARSAALAGMPQVITPGKGMIAVSFGGAGDAKSVAVGLSKSFADQHLLTRAAASFTTRTNEVSWNVGAGLEF